MSVHDEYPVLGELPALPPLPPRTALYRLDPLGVGTGARESLTSYVERLMEAHCLSPKCLRQVDSMDISPSYKFEEVPLLYEARFNAGGMTSIRWAALLAQLTGCPGLEALTLSPVAKIVNRHNRTSRNRRWCAECLKEAESSGVAYAQLIWEIACVNACPLHEIELSGQCACSPTPIQSHRSTRAALPGRCLNCTRQLSAVLPRRKARLEEVRIARIARELLADPRFDRGGWQTLDDRSGEFLRTVAAIHYGGHLTTLAKSLGDSKGKVHEWAHGKHRPALTWMIALADRVGCSITDVLSGRAEATHPPNGPIIRRQRAAYRILTAAQRAMIAERLRAAASDCVPVSLSALGQQLCVSRRFLRDRFPAESAVIVSRFAAHQKSQGIAKKNAFSSTLRQKAEQLLAQGIWPSSRRLVKGVSFPARYGVLRHEVNEIVAEARRQVKVAGTDQAAQIK